MKLTKLRNLRMIFAGAATFLPALASAEFIRPTQANDPLVYGVKNGIVLAIHPFALDARKGGGPRGLIRVGYEEDGSYHLINYIAIEPLVASVQGLSELEQGSDGSRGKQFWIGDSLQDQNAGQSANTGGRMEETPAGRVLTFILYVEPFANGARPIVEVSLFEQYPNRARFKTFSDSRGKPMNRCALTATMGNSSRCRFLWLRSEAIFAPTLYADYKGSQFVEKAPYPIDALWKTTTGDVVAAVTPDEFEPREVWPLPTDQWHYGGKWLAQYWLKPKGSYDQSLQCRVNGRRVYWAGNILLPGGIAYENFEFREKFYQGQEVWFGYTPESPAKAFGFGYDASPLTATPRQVPAVEAAATLDAARIARPLTNGDFTSGFDGWQREGDTSLFQLVPSEDKVTLITDANHKEAHAGRLYQCFKIPDNASELQFTLQGGADYRHAAVVLWRGGRLYRKMTARNDDIPFRVRWNVKPLRGEVVTLEIVDDGTIPVGSIGVHGFTLTGA